MSELNDIIHQPVRLRIMAALASLGLQRHVDFAFLKQRLELTDGNLGAHLRALEEAGYVVVDKAFVERRPKTYIAASEAGRKAFTGHVLALQTILRIP